DDGGATTGSHWQPSRFDLALIQQGTVVVDAAGQHAGVLQVGTASGGNALLDVVNGWLEAHTAVEVGSATGEGKLVVGADGLLIAPAVQVGPGGTVAGSGEILGNVFNDGLVSPGDSIGTLTIDGDFVQGDNGTLLLEIASATEYDKLLVSSSMLLGGGLQIDLLDYSPQAGDSFDLIDFASADGSLTLGLPELQAGLAWDH